MRKMVCVSLENRVGFRSDHCWGCRPKFFDKPKIRKKFSLWIKKRAQLNPDPFWIRNTWVWLCWPTRRDRKNRQETGKGKVQERNRLNRAQIFKLLGSHRIDSKEQLGTRFLAPIDCLKIPAKGEPILNLGEQGQPDAAAKINVEKKARSNRSIRESQAF